MGCVEEETNRPDEPVRGYYPRKLPDANGEIFWPDIQGFRGYGGVDNAFEGFHRWPLFYLLRGDDRLLALAQFSRLKFDRPHGYGTWMESYSLAFYYVPGVETMMDLSDRENAKRYGQVYSARLKRCDTATNMESCRLIVPAGAFAEHIFTTATFVG